MTEPTATAMWPFRTYRVTLVADGGFVGGIVEVRAHRVDVSRSGALVFTSRSGHVLQAIAAPRWAFVGEEEGK